MTKCSHSKVAWSSAILLVFYFPAGTVDAAENKAAFTTCIDMAERIATQISPSQRRNMALAKIVLAYARRDDAVQIEVIANRIDDPRARAMALLDANRYSKLRDQNKPAATALLQAASESAAKVHNSDLRDNLYWQIAYAQALNGHVEQARATSDLIESLRAYDQAFYQIAAAQAHNGDLRGALGTAETIRPSRWRSDAFAVIAGAMARTGDLVEARGIADRSHDQTSSALWFMTVARSKVGDREGALALAREIPSLSLRVLALRSIAGEAASSGSTDIARATYREAHAITRERPRGYLLAEIAAEQGKAKLFEDAFATADDLEALPRRERSVKEGNDLVWALAEIGQAQASVGQLDHARRTMERARKVLPNGQHRAAIGIVRLAMAIGDLESAKEVAGSPPDPAALQAIAVELAKQGNFDGAAKMITEIERVRGRDYVDYSLFHIAVEQVRRNDLDAALNTMAQISDTQIQVFALAEMATSAR